ncbi:MAG TPA: hypothetical protein VIV11_41440 [Kofleriaceae bacterium]
MRAEQNIADAVVTTRSHDDDAGTTRSRNLEDRILELPVHARHGHAGGCEIRIFITDMHELELRIARSGQCDQRARSVDSASRVVGVPGGDQNAGQSDFTGRCVHEAAGPVGHDEHWNIEVASDRLADTAAYERREAVSSVGADDDEVRVQAVQSVEHRVGDLVATLVAAALV